MSKLITVVIAVAVVVGGGAFYGGMKYAESKAPQSRLSQADFQNFRNRTGGQQAGGFASGEIIGKDDKSVTIKLRDARLPEGQGGSKIIFYSSATEIGKLVNGAANDLEIGKSVVINGKVNQDGSITAESIQLRSNLLGVSL